MISFDISPQSTSATVRIVTPRTALCSSVVRQKPIFIIIFHVVGASCNIKSSRSRSEEPLTLLWCTCVIVLHLPTPDISKHQLIALHKKSMDVSWPTPGDSSVNGPDANQI